MRVRIAIGIAIASSAGAATLVAPSHAAGGQNITNGHGLTSSGAEIRINAHGDPSGAAKGRFSLLEPTSGLDVEGTVTCLRVRGSDSVAGGVLSDGSGFWQFTTDAGPKGIDSSDTVILTVPTSCPEPRQGRVAVDGNYTVRSAKG